MIEPMFVFISLCNMFGCACCVYHGHWYTAGLMLTCGSFNLYCGFYLKKLKDKDEARNNKDNISFHR